MGNKEAVKKLLGMLKGYRKIIALIIALSLIHILNREDCVGCRYFKCCKSASCLYGNYKMTGYLNKTNSFFCGYRKILYRINEEKL